MGYQLINQWGSKTPEKGVLKMRKVTMIGVALAFVFGVYVCGVAPVVKAQTIQLKFAHFMSPMHIQHQKSFVPFSKKVEELTNGQVTVKIYPGGALGGPKQLPDAAKTGITDIAFTIPAYTTGRFPRTSVFDLPFMFDSALHTTKALYTLAYDYIADDYKDYKVLWFYSCGPGQLHSVTKPIHSVEDLKGMKMRTPGAYMSKALKLCGANPVGMPISKLTMSLEKKVIDGMLTPYSAVIDFRLWDLVKYIADVNMYTMPMAVLMNKQKWNSLPDPAKRAINDASGMPWGLHAAQVYDDHDQNMVNQNKDSGKVEIYKVTPSEKKKFISAVKGMETDWINEASKRGLAAKELLEATKKSAEINR
jgi:TRAP-type C4-dicarboxylate transport system substrate-binding protein